LRTVVAALRAWSGIAAVAWATAGLAASGGTGEAVVPHGVATASSPKISSIQLLRKQPTVAGTCGGSAFDVNTLINVDNVASADVTVTAPGVGTIEEFTDETGTNIGPYNAAYPTFHILPFGGGLPPNTTITITITTYSGTNKTGSVTFTSTLLFNCTTGQVIKQKLEPAESIPTLSTAALFTMMALLALLGGAMTRRLQRERR
jgi:exosortase sorting signal-containing protein